MNIAINTVSIAGVSIVYFNSYLLLSGGNTETFFWASELHVTSEWELLDIWADSSRSCEVLSKLVGICTPSIQILVETL